MYLSKIHETKWMWKFMSWGIFIYKWSAVYMSTCREWVRRKVYQPNFEIFLNFNWWVDIFRNIIDITIILHVWDYESFEIMLIRAMVHEICLNEYLIPHVIVKFIAFKAWFHCDVLCWQTWNSRVYWTYIDSIECHLNIWYPIYTLGVFWVWIFTLGVIIVLAGI